MFDATLKYLTILIYIKLVSCKPPHIIFLLADDYGFNDIGYHNAEISTPNLDKLAKTGVVLENYYVQPICTPSRSQLMTGRYQIHTGLQHGIIMPCQAHCLPLDEVILPQKLKEVGYKTHAVGKWHLGYFKKECLPTNRGFDSYNGYLLGSQDYYTKNKCDRIETSNHSKQVCGYDFHKDTEPDFSANGTYSAFLYEKIVKKIIKEHNVVTPLFLYMPFQSVHAPMQAPQKYLDMYAYINNTNRRYYSAMVTAMDDAIGNIIEAINDKGIANETLIVFSTDNGGQTIYGGNNWPLRGRKGTLWEGGVHGLGFIHGAGVQNPGRVSNELVHISDWLPTLLHVAGGNTNGTKPLDGYNIWEAISTDNIKSPRNEILHNIDPMYNAPFIHPPPMKPYPNKFGIDTTYGHSALRMGHWKLLQGYPGFDKHVPVPNLEHNISYQEKNWNWDNALYPSIQLFNIIADPTETQNVADKFPSIVDEMLQRIVQYNSTAVPVVYPDLDPKCDPALRGGVWGPWPLK